MALRTALTTSVGTIVKKELRTAKATLVLVHIQSHTYYVVFCLLRQPVGTAHAHRHIPMISCQRYATVSLIISTDRYTCNQDCVCWLAAAPTVTTMQLYDAECAHSQLIRALLGLPHPASTVEVAHKVTHRYLLQR